MPRAKYDNDNPYNLLFHEIGWFKVNYTDFLYDFRYIYDNILTFYGEDLPEDYRTGLSTKLEIISKAHVKPAFKNRMYIVTGMHNVVLAAVDLDDVVFENLVETYEFLESVDNSILPAKLNMCFVTAMYLFKGDHLCRIDYLTSRKLAEFMMVFKNENLVNYQGARDSWYGKPRREARKKS